MTSKRDIDRRLNQLEESHSAEITPTQVYDWICALQHSGSEAGRPMEYFEGELRWSDEMLELHSKTITRHQEMEHVTPAEAFALTYMDENIQREVLELLATDPNAEVFPTAANPD